MLRVKHKKYCNHNLNTFFYIMYIYICSNPEKQTSFTSYQKIGAFADNKIHRDSKSDIEDIPFLNLIQDDIKIDDKTVLNVKELSKSSKSRNDSCDSDRRESSSHASGDGEKLHESVLSNHSSISQELPPDDFVMVELVGFLFICLLPPITYQGVDRVT